LHHQQPAKDEQNVDFAPPAENFLRTPLPQWCKIFVQRTFPYYYSVCFFLSFRYWRRGQNGHLPPWKLGQRTKTF